MCNGTILTIHLAATWFMTGLIWFVQIVHYPLMRMLGKDEFIAYSIRHQSTTSLVVGPPMLIEVVTAVLLLALDGELRKSSWFLASGGLLAVIWLSTALWQMPLHRALLNGFDDAKLRELVRSNWVRTIAWNARSVIVSWLILAQ